MLHVDIEHQLGEFSLDIHVQFEPGLTALFGPSGAGKTSLIHAVAGILNPRVGRIVLGERVLLDTEKGIRIPTHLRHCLGKSPVRAAISRGATGAGIVG